MKRAIAAIFVGVSVNSHDVSADVSITEGPVSGNNGSDHHEAGCDLFDKVLRLFDERHIAGTLTVGPEEVFNAAIEGILNKAGSVAISDPENPSVQKSFSGSDNFSGLTRYAEAIKRKFKRAASSGAPDYKSMCLDYIRQFAGVAHLMTRESLDKLYAEAIEEVVRQTRGGFSFFSHESEEVLEIKQNLSGTVYGAGIIVSNYRENNGLVIIDVLPDSPAWEAGIRRGDILKELNAVPVNTHNTRSINERLKSQGPFNLAIERDGKIRDYKFAAKEITDDTVTGYLLTDLPDTAVMRIEYFTKYTPLHILQELLYLNHKNKGPVRNIIFDLSDNPGGTVSGLLQTMSIFLHDNYKRVPLITIADLKGETKKTIYSDDPASLPGSEIFDPIDREDLLDNGFQITGIPSENGEKTAIRYIAGGAGVKYAVVINGWTASAAEIMAGSFKEEGHPVVGLRSYGKGTSQTVITVNGNPVAAGEEAKRYIAAMTNAIVSPGAGNSYYNGHGVTPDTKVYFADHREITERSPYSKKSTGAYADDAKINQEPVLKTCINLIGGKVTKEAWNVPIVYFYGRSQSRMFRADIACAAKVMGLEVLGLGSDYVKIQPYNADSNQGLGGINFDYN